jgi:hypothetical protein
MCSAALDGSEAASGVNLRIPYRFGEERQPTRPGKSTAVYSLFYMIHSLFIAVGCKTKQLSTTQQQ